jgi:hypothetical protein
MTHKYGCVSDAAWQNINPPGCQSRKSHFSAAMTAPRIEPAAENLCAKSR